MTHRLNYALSAGGRCIRMHIICQAAEAKAYAEFLKAEAAEAATH
jgi:hypothetical protein